MEIEELYRLYRRSEGVSTDTRADLNNRLFFCLKGPNFDANDFVQEALKKGALAVISDNSKNRGKEKVIVVNDSLEALQELAIRHRKSFSFPVFGLTGSNGKTTNKELIHAVLSKKYRTYATKGNLNNHIGVPLTVLDIGDDAEFAVIEMGANHQGEIRELSKISDPDYGMITNIGKAHLEGFGGIEGVKKGKKELFDHIRAKGAKLFVNGDDEVLMEISEGIERTLFGSDSSFFVSGKIERSTPTLSFSFQFEEYKSDEIITQLTGDYNFYNLMAAVCLGKYFGVENTDIEKALADYNPTNNRSQIKKTESNTLILDAYNANPTSMLAAVENLSKMPSPRKMALLGHMLELGDDARLEHENLLQKLHELKIDAILVGKHFKECNPTFPVFDNSEELRDYLKENPLKDFQILVKGSRSVQMEKILPSL
jgi:UDP-N-acetylmuramoyl-tripeptide--D-alanyl-D-alanine ligase